jgi:hypothetical protein
MSFPRKRESSSLCSYYVTCFRQLLTQIGMILFLEGGLGELCDGFSDNHLLFCRLFVLVEQLGDVGGFGIACVDDDAVFERELFAFGKVQLVTFEPVHRRRREKAVIAGEPFAGIPAIGRILQNGDAFEGPVPRAGVIAPG